MDSWLILFVFYFGGYLLLLTLANLLVFAIIYLVKNKEIFAYFFEYEKALLWGFFPVTIEDFIVTITDEFHYYSLPFFYIVFPVIFILRMKYTYRVSGSLYHFVTLNLLPLFAASPYILLMTEILPATIVGIVYIVLAFLTSLFVWRRRTAKPSRT
jgi:hypothetical protein